MTCKRRRIRHCWKKRSDAAGQPGMRPRTHGLLSGRLAIAGADGGHEWLDKFSMVRTMNDALQKECASDMLAALFEATYAATCPNACRSSPLLPDDEDQSAPCGHRRWRTGARDTCMAWCRATTVRRSRLVWPNEPVADIIKDMLQITRAACRRCRRTKRRTSGLRGDSSSTCGLRRSSYLRRTR